MQEIKGTIVSGIGKGKGFIEEPKGHIAEVMPDGSVHLIDVE